MPTSTRPLVIWLFTCCIMVALMVWIGGVTRLTNSGLSIVEWKPIHGTIPPLNEPEWLEEFAKYKESPEYQQINKGMDLEGFKDIFFLEYVHRLIGRSIGIIFLVPYVYFLIRKQLSKPLALKLLGIFALGGLQGFMGWYMVKSGLNDIPAVSHYRLAMHLGIAFVIFALFFVTALRVHSPHSPVEEKSKKRSRSGGRGLVKLLPTLIFFQTLLGALVAGLDAGLVYNTFPTMNGQWIPSEWLSLSPWYMNFLENHATVQFIHRTIAYIVLCAVVATWLTFRKHTDSSIRAAAYLLLAMVFVQLTLGIMTLLAQVPVHLASAHQMGALALFTIALYLWQSVLYKRT